MDNSEIIKTVSTSIKKKTMESTTSLVTDEHMKALNTFESTVTITLVHASFHIFLRNLNAFRICVWFFQ